MFYLSLNHCCAAATASIRIYNLCKTTTKKTEKSSHISNLISNGVITLIVRESIINKSTALLKKTACFRLVFDPHIWYTLWQHLLKNTDWTLLKYRIISRSVQWSRVWFLWSANLFRFWYTLHKQRYYSHSTWNYTSNMIINAQSFPCSHSFWPCLSLHVHQHNAVILTLQLIKRINRNIFSSS